MVGEGDGDAQSGGSGGNRRRADGGGNDTFFTQSQRSRYGLFVFTNDNRNDLALALQGIESGIMQQGSEIGGVGLQYVPEVGRGFQHIHCAEGGADDGGRRGRGIDEGARGMDQQLAQIIGTGDESAEAGQRLAQGAHRNGDRFFQTLLANQSGAVGPERPGGMRLIHQKHRAMLFRQCSDFLQRCKVAIHAEH